MPVFLEHENKLYNGVSDVIWRSKPKYSNFSEKNNVEFVKTYNLRKRFSKNVCRNVWKMFFRSYLNPSSVNYNLSAYEQQHF